MQIRSRGRNFSLKPGKTGQRERERERERLQNTNEIPSYINTMCDTLEETVETK